MARLPSKDPAFLAGPRFRALKPSLHLIVGLFAGALLTLWVQSRYQCDTVRISGPQTKTAAAGNIKAGVATFPPASKPPPAPPQAPPPPPTPPPPPPPIFNLYETADTAWSDQVMRTVDQHKYFKCSADWQRLPVSSNEVTAFLARNGWNASMDVLRQNEVVQYWNMTGMPCK